MEDHDLYLDEETVNGLNLYSAFLTSGDSSPALVNPSSLAQGHLKTQLGIKLATFRLTANPLYLLSYLTAAK